MTTPTFKLTVDGIDLTLVEFDGEEEMNRLFKYTFTTEIPSSGEKLADVIDGDAIFSIKEFDTTLHTGDIDIPGYISKASKSIDYWILEFSPKLLKTTMNSRSEVYFKEDKSLNVEEVIEAEFNDNVVISDHEPHFNITATLPTRKIFCQFHESDLNFIARLCDHWGFHFYFDHYTSKLVIADNSSYDQQFDVVLKTTNTAGMNAFSTILNWNESLSSTLSYSTITGYDPENAGTAITASYPADGAGSNGKTEAVEILADITSQDEADYIAQIRHESFNCLNHNASGEVKIPYLYPGFLINTDDNDFSKALIIKTVIAARNLNSTNPGTAASYSCQFQAIPDTTCFRPNKFYPVPSATNVIGKVISETDNINQAQRNSSGEYKAELLGFDNETSTHPWLRKAQSTASNNSVDIPLTPETEVLIAFVDNNPNCPYIQHALDNSLHPSPVTNANPHHAIISTHGMLVNSSLEGRYNYAITSKTTESGYQGVNTANYFEGRGNFDQHTNFIDPSASNSDFTADDENSGDLIFTRHSGDFVEIREGDMLTWHNGNIYDFGGYWNYNLGNSYEENFIDQEAPLNIKVAKDNRTGDILTDNGPIWGSINFNAIKVNSLEAADVTPASYGSTSIPTDRNGKTFEVNTDGAWGSGGMNVSKSYNSSYDYKFGEGIDISDRVNSLEITHTDGATTAIEMNFHNGALRSWEKTEGRKNWSKSWAGNGNKTSESSTITETDTISNPFVPGETFDVYTKTEKEDKWDIQGNNKASSTETVTKGDTVKTDSKTHNISDGALATHNITTTNGLSSDVMDFSYQETNKAEFNFGGERKFGISAQGTASLAISLSGAIDISIEASLKLNMKANASLSIEIEADAGGKIELNNGKFEYSITGLHAKIASPLEAAMKTLHIGQKVTDIEKQAIRLNDVEMKLQSHKIAIRAGGIVMDGL